MKKILLGLALSLVFVLPTSAAEFNSNLKFGSKGAEVTKLQEFLTEQGVYSGPITGNFFSLTLKAVKAFQLREEITPVSGFFGTLTRTRANAILDTQLVESEAETVSDPVVEVGSPVSAEVLRLNEILGAVQNQTVVNNQQLAAVQEQNQILQNTLALQQTEADRLRALADAAEAEAVARLQAEQAARDLAAQQAAVEASRPLYTPEELKARYLNYAGGGLNLLLHVTTQLDIVEIPNAPSIITKRVNFSRSGSYETWGNARVVFNGETVIDPRNNIENRSVYGLDSSRKYSYQIIYPSPGREDSVYEGTF